MLSKKILFTFGGFAILTFSTKIFLAKIMLVFLCKPFRVKANKKKSSMTNVCLFKWEKVLWCQVKWHSFSVMRARIYFRFYLYLLCWFTGYWRYIQVVFTVLPAAPPYTWSHTFLIGKCATMFAFEFIHFERFTRAMNVFSLLYSTTATCHIFANFFFFSSQFLWFQM